MKNIKLIATDMDGTLLNKEQEVSAKNAESMREAVRSGIPVILASGRSFKSVRKFSLDVGINCPIIGSNGACIVASIDGEVLHEMCLAPALAKKAHKILDENNLYHEVYHESGIYQSKDKGREHKETGYETPEGNQFQVRFIKDDALLERVALEKAHKIVVFCPMEEVPLMLKVRKQFEDMDEYEINSSWWSNFEIMAKGVHKGAALTWLSSYMGINMQDTIAFGDNENDEKMLQAAGIAVAMENATERLKSIADIIAPNHNEDGFAEIVNKYVLNECE